MTEAEEVTTASERISAAPIDPRHVPGLSQPPDSVDAALSGRASTSGAPNGGYPVQWVLGKGPLKLGFSQCLRPARDDDDD